MARNWSATAASEAASTLPSRKLPELSRTLYEYVVVICVSFRSGPRPVAGADQGEEVRPVRAVLQTHLLGDPTRPHQLGQVGVERLHSRAPTRLESTLDLLKLSVPDERPDPGVADHHLGGCRSEEHTSELQSLMRISYA